MHSHYTLPDTDLIPAGTVTTPCHTQIYYRQAQSLHPATHRFNTGRHSHYTLPHTDLISAGTVTTPCHTQIYYRQAQSQHPATHRFNTGRHSHDTLIDLNCNCDEAKANTLQIHIHIFVHIVIDYHLLFSQSFKTFWIEKIKSKFRLMNF